MSPSVPGVQVKNTDLRAKTKQEPMDVQFAKESGDGLALDYAKILKTSHDRPYTGAHGDKGREDVQHRLGKGAYKTS